MTHIDSFFNDHFIVNFSGGAMGTFMCNFLGDNGSRIYVDKLKNKTHFGMQENFEWKQIDYFNQMREETSNQKENFQKHFGSDWEKYYLYTYASIYYNKIIAMYSGKQLDHSYYSQPDYENKEIALLDNLEKYLDQRLDKTVLYFPAIKSHPIDPWQSPHFKLFESPSLKWQQKLELYFPKDKAWIQILFLLWKAYVCKVDNIPVIDNNRSNPDSPFFANFEHALNENISMNFAEQIDYTKFSEPLEGYTKINMYKLLFENDLSEIEQALPDFKMTEEKAKILSLAQETSLNILKKFSLNHTMSINGPINFRHFALHSRIYKYMTQYRKMSK